MSEVTKILLSEWQYWSEFKAETTFQVTAFRQTLTRIMDAYEKQKIKLQELLNLLPRREYNLSIVLQIFLVECLIPSSFHSSKKARRGVKSKMTELKKKQKGNQRELEG